MLVPIATAAWLTRLGPPYVWTVQYILCGIVELMESVDTTLDEFEVTYKSEALVTQTPNSYRFKLLHSFFFKKILSDNTSA